MKIVSIVLITSVILLASCADNKKKIVDNYLISVNNNNIEELSMILSENFRITIKGDTTIDKKTFFNELNNNFTIPSKKELFEWKSINDSTIETIELDGYIFQQRTNLIPKFKTKKSYFIRDNKITRIYKDTLPGTKETKSLLDYVIVDFISWSIDKKFDYNSDTSLEILSSAIDKFYSTYPLQEIITKKIYLVDKFIEFLKGYKYSNDSYTGTYNEVFNKIAGLQGTVSWESFVSKKFIDHPDIRVVEINIERNKDDSEFKSLKLQYFVNPRNGVAELAYGEINGVEKSKLTLFMTLIMLIDSGAYI